MVAGVAPFLIGQEVELASPFDRMNGRKLNPWRVAEVDFDGRCATLLAADGRISLTFLWPERVPSEP